MAQTIKIRRGGIGAIGSSTPTTLKGELILATGSFSGGVLGTSLFAAEADDTLRLTHGRIDSVSDGSALATAIGNNNAFTGLLIHSASDNKLYRYSGTAFVELPIAAGSFEGILPIANGGTGTSSLGDIVGDSKVVVQNGTDTIIAGSDGPVVLTLSGGVVTGSAQIDGANIANNTVGFGGVSVALGSTDDTPAFNLQDATGYPGDSNLVTLGTVTTGDVSAILPAGTVSGSAQIDGTAIQNNTITIAGTSTALGGSITYATITNGTGTISGSAQVDGTAITNNTITIAGNSTALGGTVTLAQITDGSGIISSSAQIDELFNVDGLISSSVLSSPSQGTALLTNNGAAGSNIDLGLQTDDSPTFASLTLTGDLTVQGTTTTIDSETLNISSSIVRVNFGGAVANGGMEVTDATGGTTVTGSLLWNGTEDYWIAGPKASEKRIVTFNANDPTNDSFIHLNGSDEVVAIASGSTVGAFLQKTAGGFEVSAVIDGGTF